MLNTLIALVLGLGGVWLGGWGLLTSIDNGIARKIENHPITYRSLYTPVTLVWKSIYIWWPQTPVTTLTWTLTTPRGWFYGDPYVVLLGYRLIGSWWPQYVELELNPYDEHDVLLDKVQLLSRIRALIIGHFEEPSDAVETNA